MKEAKDEKQKKKKEDDLMYATQMKLRKTGNVDASKIVTNLTKSSRIARKYAAAMKKVPLKKNGTNQTY